MHTHSYVDVTRDHSAVHSTVGVCLVCVTLRLCEYLTKESSMTEGKYGSTREENAGSNARYSHVIC